jgi:alpha-L-fucosidase
VGTEIGWSRGGERRGRKDATTGEIPVEVYDNLYKKFNPVKFDPDEWVRLAKDAGMKYLVFTSKHHDGFCNFDSKLTNYKITSPESPYRKDIVKQVSDACHRGGIDWGVYYSQPDWHHPDYRNGEAHRRYVEYLYGQVRELLTNYGKTSMWFFDGLSGSAADWDAWRLIGMMRTLQPHLVINNRAGIPADNDTPEQRIGMFQNNRPWETCATVGSQWAYKPRDTLRSIEECLRGLICCAIGDGNLLFNVGPRPDGLIEESHAARLREMGDFLKKYGESIHATRGGPFIAADEKKRPPNARGFALAEGNWWGGSTHKGNVIYLHILRWPSDTITLPAIPRRIVRHSVLTGGSAAMKQSVFGIEVGVPVGRRHPVDTIVRLQLDGLAGAIAPIRPA